MNPSPSSAARPIDVRSDTVTRPDAAMRRAMHDAEVGDDVYGDDPTVNRLEAVAAERLGHEAALFLPTGTQSNLVALLTHCGRGDEYVVGHDAHTYKYEGGGAAALGGIQPQTVPFDERGGLAVEAVAAVVKEDDPRTSPAPASSASRTRSTGACRTSRAFARCAASRPGAVSRCTSTARAWPTPASRSASTSSRWGASSTASRCACRRGSVRRSARCSRAGAASSTRRAAGAR